MASDDEREGLVPFSRKRASRHRECVFVLLVVCLVLAVTTGVYAYRWANREVAKPCFRDVQCIQTPQEYLEVFSQTRADGLLTTPACVADSLLGRVVAIPNAPDNVNITTLAPVGYGQRIVFAFDSSTLEKMLVYGQFGATEIMREVGYGDQYSCGDAPDYSCQFRLIVWSTDWDCNQRALPPHSRAYWDNLLGFLGRSYGARLPNIEQAVLEIKSQSLVNLTQCDPGILIEGEWNATIQEAAGCSEAFRGAMDMFQRLPCTGTQALQPRYMAGAACPAEELFLDRLKNGDEGERVTGVELRAFLMQTCNFNPFYTGYGFTANENFRIPLVAEYWIPNDYLTDLHIAEVISFFNGTSNNLKS